MKLNWGHGILIFIILFLALITTFVIFALYQSQDLVSDDYYDQGAGYTSQMEVNKRSDRYKDSITMAYTQPGVEISLCKSMAASGDSIHIYFYRPSDKKSDIKLNSLMSETIFLPASELKSGRYVVKISWTHKGELFNVNKDLIIP
ncbi:MAG: FixH family protein [Bacteroidota bacterium]